MPPLQEVIPREEWEKVVVYRPEAMAKNISQLVASLAEFTTEELLERKKAIGELYDKYGASAEKRVTWLMRSAILHVRGRQKLADESNGTITTMPVGLEYTPPMGPVGALAGGFDHDAYKAPDSGN